MPELKKLFVFQQETMTCLKVHAWKEEIMVEGWFVNPSTIKKRFDPEWDNGKTFGSWAA